MKGLGSADPASLALHTSDRHPHGTTCGDKGSVLWLHDIPLLGTDIGPGERN